MASVAPQQAAGHDERAAGLAALSAAAGLPLAEYGAQHVDRRIADALATHDVADQAALVAVLRADRSARALFRRSIAISVTGMFRDASQFDDLAGALPSLRRVERPRVWSAGCANGSELWTLAIVLHRRRAAARSVFVGSDVLEENVAAARQHQHQRQFDGFALPPVWHMRFDVRDLTQDPSPPAHFQIVLCRNLAIYLSPTARARVHRVVAESLAPGGLLLLGRSERLSDASELGLEPAGPHLYRRAA